MNINWYPGHMKKTRESIKKSISMVDLVIELLDARIPYSSKNPIIDELVRDKPRIVLLNKMDLANENINREWQSFYGEKGVSSLLFDSRSSKGIDRLIKLVNEETKERRLAYESRGVINRPVRAMIVGIPNVGKSTLINSLTGRKGARIGNKPGVTKANQWIKTKGGLELLDTPGILWPKFEDKEVGLNLAYIGSIKDDILDIESLALSLIERLVKLDPTAIINRYKIELKGSPLEIMEEIARKRGCLIRGGEIDYTKVANIILDEFRKGIIGRISLERPEVIVDA